MDKNERKIRVLVVDDSALVRKIISEGLAKDPQIEVVATARDAAQALELIALHHPDVITLDVEMPGMDGVTFLRKYLPSYPIPTIIVSSYTESGKKITLEALEAGAVDIVLKPRMGIVDGLPAIMDDLCGRVKAAARTHVRLRAASAASRAVSNVDDGVFTTSQEPAERQPAPSQEANQRVIVIGASAGGISALASIIPAFPADTPAILIVQHIPAGFSTSFAQRLKMLSKMEVKEAQDGDLIRPGQVLLAPGGERHLEIVRAGGELRTALNAGPRVSGHQPSVNVLFRSAARTTGAYTAAALLTGMGEDGAAGLLAIRLAGGRTFCQDEPTSVVWGMPGAAWKMGAAEAMAPLEEIPARLMWAVKKM